MEHRERYTVLLHDRDERLLGLLQAPTRRGDAAVDTWRNQGDASDAPTRGEAASGESPFEPDERP